jgi:tetratricopeptide (TPR) repeat protein
MRGANLGAAPTAIPMLDNPLAAAPWPARLLTAARVQLDYVWLQVWPVGLSSDYSFSQIPVIHSPANGHVIAAVLGMALAAGAAWICRRDRPIVSLAIAGYAALFAVTANVIAPIGTIMAERLAYAPSLMFCTLAAGAAEAATRRLGRPALVAAAVVVIVLCGVTMSRNRSWASEEAFHAAQVRSAPNSARAHFGLGATYAAAGADRQAVVAYQRALAIYPNYSDAFFNLGNALRRLDADPEEIVVAYRNAVSSDPGNVRALENLARFLWRLGRDDEAFAVLGRLNQLRTGRTDTAMD